MAQRLKRELDELVLKLHKDDKRSFRDIGRVLNVHFTTVRERYLRAVGERGKVIPRNDLTIV